MKDLHTMNRKSGFTIVELLIVIVVIAILAAISVVAYTGIQNRAHNSAVQNDLAQFGKKIQLAAADSGSIPSGGMTTLTATTPSTGSVVASPGGVSMKLSKDSYLESAGQGAANFIYCSGPSASNNQPTFSIAATSKAGVLYRHSQSSGISTVIASGAGTPGVAQACSGIDYPISFSYGFFVNINGWQSWTLN